jgi:opacity protein-like surface antigen
MKLLFASVLTFLLVAFASAAQSGDVCPPAKDYVCVGGPTGYVFAYGGFSFGHDTESNIDLHPLAKIGIDTDVDGGYILGGGFGLQSCAFGGSRFEFEGLYSSNDMETLGISFNGLPVGTLPITGDLDTTAFFMNFIKTFPIGNVTGYAGAGIGVAMTDWTIRTGAIGIPLGLSGDDTSLAYQVKVGADFPVGDNLSIFGEYKLIGVTDSDYTAIVLPVNTDGYISHNLVFGARIAF